jgi:hypothetical protein
MGGIFIPFHSVNDEAAHGPCVSSLVPITVDGIGFLLLGTVKVVPIYEHDNGPVRPSFVTNDRYTCSHP